MIDKVSYHLIHKIIEIGRKEQLPSNFSTKNMWWQHVLDFNKGDGCDDLSTEALKCFFKGVVLTEKESDRYMGSTTNTAFILGRLKNRLKDSNNEEIMDALYDFGITNRGKNSYVPTSGYL